MTLWILTHLLLFDFQCSLVWSSHLCGIGRGRKENSNDFRNDNGTVGGTLLLSLPSSFRPCTNDWHFPIHVWFYGRRLSKRTILPKVWYLRDQSFIWMLRYGPVSLSFFSSYFFPSFAFSTFYLVWPLAYYTPTLLFRHHISGSGQTFLVTTFRRTVNTLHQANFYPVSVVKPSVGRTTLVTFDLEERIDIAYGMDS